MAGNRQYDHEYKVQAVKPDGQDREAEAQEDILRREPCGKAKSRIKSKEE